MSNSHKSFKNNPFAPMDIEMYNVLVGIENGTLCLSDIRDPDVAEYIDRIISIGEKATQLMYGGIKSVSH